MLIIEAVTILLTMTTMFRSVSKIEKQEMHEYEVRPHRFRTTPAGAPTTNNHANHQQEARGFAAKMKKLGKYLCLKADASQTNYRFAICCLRYPCAGHAAGCYDPERPSRTTKSNKMTSRKRAVLNMAHGYAGAWLFVWTHYLVMIISVVVTKSYPHAFTLYSLYSPAQAGGGHACKTKRIRYG